MAGFQMKYREALTAKVREWQEHGERARIANEICDAYGDP